jgi:hypothetical protein
LKSGKQKIEITKQKLKYRNAVAQGAVRHAVETRLNFTVCLPKLYRSTAFYRFIA